LRETFDYQFLAEFRKVSRRVSQKIPQKSFKNQKGLT